MVVHFLAEIGMIGLTVDPQGVGDSQSLGDPPCTGQPRRTNPSPCPNVPFQQMDNFFDAGQSALDFLLGTSDPWLAHIDTGRIGATGHSEGARAATYLQDPAFDGRVDSVVALDNLTTNYCGDAGTPSNEGPGGGTGVQNAVINGEPYCLTDPLNSAFVVHPTKPAMGLASDGPGGLGSNDPTGVNQGPASEKEAAALAWRSSGLATAEYVLAGVSHLQFSQSSTSKDPLLHRIAIYADAWFRFTLEDDATAVTSLTSCQVLGQSMSDFLSASYLSSVYLPSAGVDNGDVRGGCAGQ